MNVAQRTNGYINDSDRITIVIGTANMIAVPNHPEGNRRKPITLSTSETHRARQD